MNDMVNFILSLYNPNFKIKRRFKKTLLIHGSRKSKGFPGLKGATRSHLIDKELQYYKMKRVLPIDDYKCTTSLRHLISLIWILK